MHPQLQRGQDHQPRLAAALEMPDQALLWITRHNAIHDLVSCEVLLVTTDHLDTAVLTIGSEEREILEDVQNYFRSQHAFDCGSHMAQLAFFLVLFISPRSPDIDWHANGAI